MSRARISTADKTLVLKEIDKNKTQSEVDKQYGISQSCVSRIVRQNDVENCGKTGRKRKRTCNYEDIDEALWQWFKKVRARELPINGPMLVVKAQNLADDFGLNNVTITRSWIQRWQKRHDLVFKRLTEKSSCDDSESEESSDDESADKDAGEEEAPSHNEIFQDAPSDKEQRRDIKGPSDQPARSDGIAKKEEVDQADDAAGQRKNRTTTTVSDEEVLWALETIRRFLIKNGAGLEEFHKVESMIMSTITERVSKQSKLGGLTKI